MASPMAHEPLDVAVIGAGPAGLQAAATIARATDRFVLIDAGRAVARRDRHAAGDLLSGVGGAGLFSDGKFSFFPAATELWQRRDRDILRRAYDAVTERLRRHGVPCPGFPGAAERPSPAPADPPADPETWHFKDYPATYLDLDARIGLIEQLFAPSAAPRHHRLETRLVGLRRDGRRWLLALQPADNAARDSSPGHPLDSPTIELAARHVILAGGRFSPLELRSLIEPESLPLHYRRVEFGVRIEDRSSSPLFRALAGVDSKYRLVGSSPPWRGLEWRTFCCCRDGEVVTTASQLSGRDVLVTASGRADGPATGRSNIGLLVRVLDPGRGLEIWPKILDRGRGRESLFELALGDVLAGHESVLAEHLGDDGAGCLVEGLRRFCGHFPGLAESTGARLLGPAIEGVGLYPADDDLQLGDTGLWVAGDSTGRFRGIVASLVSGAYVAEQIARKLRDG